MFEAYPELYFLGLFGKVLFFSYTLFIALDLIPNIKSLLFIIDSGTLSFLFLFNCPMFIIFIIAAYDSKSSNVILFYDWLILLLDPLF